MILTHKQKIHGKAIILLFVASSKKIMINDKIM
jgi:hypothetical protein